MIKIGKDDDLSAMLDSFAEGRVNCLHIERELTAAEVQTLADFVAKSSDLRALQLSLSKADVTIQPLAAAIANSPYLRELILEISEIDVQAATALGQAIAGALSLNYLKLEFRMSPDRVCFNSLMSGVESSSSLKVFRLFCDPIPDAQALSNAFENSKSLQNVDLSNTKINDEVMAAMAGVIARSSICFQLENNEITDVGAAALSDAIMSVKSRSSKLELNLYQNLITSSGARQLAAAMYCLYMKYPSYRNTNRFTWCSVLVSEKTREAWYRLYDVCTQAHQPLLAFSAGALLKASGTARAHRLLNADANHRVMARVSTFLHQPTFKDQETAKEYKEMAKLIKARYAMS
jgi:hypothetical protein